jgi:Family of unknown function (DUF6510)
MDSASMKLDGNALAGLLREIFSLEMTMARVTCSECSKTGYLGSLPAYVQAPGAVIRCPACDIAMMRVVHDNRHYWLDFRGTRSFQISKA